MGMREKGQRTVQINLLPSMFEVVNQIKEETGAPKSKIVEYFVRLGMQTSGYGPKSQGAIEQLNFGTNPSKEDTMAYFGGRSQEELRESAKLEKIATLLKELKEAAEFIRTIDSPQVAEVEKN